MNDLRAIHELLLANHPGPFDVSNPQFCSWLETGFQNGLVRAAGVISESDYQRVVQFYVNGFRDNHIDVQFGEDSAELVWPGFVISATSGTDAAVVAAAPDSNVEIGARLVSCDGKPLDAVLTEYIDPYVANADIPHQRYSLMGRLFWQRASDNRALIKSCGFDSGVVDLQWRKINAMDLRRRIDNARKLPKLGVIRFEDVFIIGIPTFDFQSRTEVADIKGFIVQLGEVHDISRRFSIIDLRGNAGGNSFWAEEVAKKIWGDEEVRHVAAQFDWTADWRVSIANIEALRKMIVGSHMADGNRASLQALCDRMAEALTAGHRFVRDEQPPTGHDMLRSRTSGGRCYLLTDAACGSACLDFMDIAKRMPDTIHVGLPTGADSNYMEVNRVELTSGYAKLGYGMKVYRNRIRKNNEWYNPDIRWPDGPISDIAAIVNWIRGMEQRGELPDRLSGA